MPIVFLLVLWWRDSPFFDFFPVLEARLVVPVVRFLIEEPVGAERVAIARVAIFLPAVVGIVPVFALCPFALGVAVTRLSAI